MQKDFKRDFRELLWRYWGFLLRDTCTRIEWWVPLQERFQRAFVRVLEVLIERHLYKDWVVSFFCIDFILFFHSEACTPHGGRLKTDRCICIVFLILFFLSSYCTMWYQILRNNWYQSRGYFTWSNSSDMSRSWSDGHGWFYGWLKLYIPTEIVFLRFWSLYSSDWWAVYCIEELEMSWRYRKTSREILEAFCKDFGASY